MAGFGTTIFFDQIKLQAQRKKLQTAGAGLTSSGQLIQETEMEGMAAAREIVALADQIQELFLLYQQLIEKNDAEIKQMNDEFIALDESVTMTAGVNPRDFRLIGLSAYEAMNWNWHQVIKQYVDRLG